VTATPAIVTNPSQFKSCRQFAAWLGLVPQQNASGGKDRIAKMGDSYIGTLSLSEPIL
jgi:transposase